MNGNVWIALFLSLMLGACGGDGGGSHGSPGEGDGQNPTSEGVSGSETGQFIDSPVARMAYSTSSGVQGETDDQGRFTFNPGDTITFDLFGSELPPIKAHDVITPNNYAGSGNGDIAMNLARFLQTLDTDGNPDNGISLPENEDVGKVDFTLPREQFETACAQILGQLANTTSLVSAEDAQAHMDRGMLSLLTGDTGSRAWRMYRFDEDGGESMGTIIFQQGGEAGGLSGTAVQSYEHYTLVGDINPQESTDAFSIISGRIQAFAPTGDKELDQPLGLEKQDFEVLYRGRGKDDSGGFDVLIMGSSVNNLYWLDSREAAPPAVSEFHIEGNVDWFAASDDTFDFYGAAGERKVGKESYSLAGDCVAKSCGEVVEDGGAPEPWETVDLNTVYSEHGLGVIGNGESITGVVKDYGDAKDYHLIAAYSNDLQLMYEGSYWAGASEGMPAFEEGFMLWSQDQTLLEAIRDRLDSAYALDLRKYTMEVDDNGCVISAGFTDTGIDYTFGEGCGDEEPYFISYSEETYGPVFQNGPVLGLADLNGNYRCEWDSEDGSSGMATCDSSLVKSPEDQVVIKRHQQRDDGSENDLIRTLTKK